MSVDGACPGAEPVGGRAATSVTYCYTVTNTGSVTARDIVVTDAGRAVRVGALARGQSRTVARTLALPPRTPAAIDANPPAAETDADATAPPLAVAAAPGSAECEGIEVTTLVGGASVTACYVVDSHDPASGHATPVVAATPPAGGAAATTAPRLFSLFGFTPATATTLQSP